MTAAKSCQCGWRDALPGLAVCGACAEWYWYQTQPAAKPQRRSYRGPFTKPRR